MVIIANINSDYTYDPTDINIPGVGKVKRDSPLGQLLSSSYPTEVQSRPASPVMAGTQDADFYLPMNGGLHPDNAASGVSATTNLNAFLEGDRTSSIVKNRQGQAVARQAQPGDTVRFFDDYGQTGLARVTAPSQRIDQEIFTGDIPQSQVVQNGPAQYMTEDFIKQRIAAGDPNWEAIHPDDAPSVYGYNTPQGFVDINDPSPFPKLTQTQMTPARDALIKLGLSEGQNEEGIKRTLFGGEGNTGIGGSGSVLNYEVIPGTTLHVDQLPTTQQQRIGELQNKEDYLTDGEGFVAYKDLDWRQHPVFGGGVEMLPGAEKHDPMMAAWLEATQVNPDTTKKSDVKIRADQGLKSRWEPFIQTEQGLQPIAAGSIPINEHGFFDFTSDHPKVQELKQLHEAGQLKWKYVDRPITESIQNLKPGVSGQDYERALAMGDVSRFYKPGVTQEMLDAGLPSESQMLTADQAIRQIDSEQKNQLAQKNVESIELYQKSSDIRPPGSGYENYNLQNKYANISDQMALNDAYNQQWDKNPPDIYTHYSGGPVRYNDAGVAVGFGDKNLQPNVELADGIKNLLPVSDVYTSAPQWAIVDPRVPKRNIVPLQPEVVDLKALQAAQDYLRQQIDSETPKPLGAGTYSDSPMRTTGMTLGEMPVVSEAIPGAFLQHVDDQGNPIYEIHFKGKGNTPLVTPYIPSSDINKRSDELSRVLIDSGSGLYPYVGVAGEPLMNEKLSQNQAGDWVQKVSDTELVRDIDTLPDAVQKMVQLKDSTRNQLMQANVNVASPTANLNKTLAAYAGTDTATQQAGNIQSVYDNLAAVDPEMNVDTEKFNVGVAVAPGQNTNAIANLFQEHGVEPVVNGQLVMGQGELPVDKRVKFAQALRRTLAPVEPDAAIGNDPELAHLRDQWKEQRAAVMGDTADKLAAIKEQLRQKHLDSIGRPVIDPGQAAINHLANAIENANYEEPEPMRQNLNFDSDDFSMLSQDVHPMDRRFPKMQMGSLNDLYVPEAPGALVPVNSYPESVYTPTPIPSEVPVNPNWKVKPLMQWGSINDTYIEPTGIPSSNFQAQMAAATPDFNWNPSNAEAQYYGQSRPAAVAGGEMMHTSMPPAATAAAATMAETPWYRGKGLMLGGAAALGLGALAYANAKRQQDEEDMHSQQLAQMTGWR